MIRNAILSDIPRIVEMGQRFRSESSYDKYVADNAQQMKDLVELLISKNGLIVSERDGRVVGMLGFMIYSHFISGQLTAGEVFWWANPEYHGEGIKLLIEMKKRAKLAGAVNMQMIAPNRKVAHFYERIGYGFVESTYQLSL